MSTRSGPRPSRACVVQSTAPSTPAHGGIAWNGFSLRVLIRSQVAILRRPGRPERRFRVWPGRAPSTSPTCTLWDWHRPRLRPLNNSSASRAPTALSAAVRSQTLAGTRRKRDWLPRNDMRCGPVSPISSGCRSRIFRLMPCSPARGCSIANRDPATATRMAPACCARQSRWSRKRVPRP